MSNPTPYLEEWLIDDRKTTNIFYVIWDNEDTCQLHKTLENSLIT